MTEPDNRSDDVAAAFDAVSEETAPDVEPVEAEVHTEAVEVAPVEPVVTGEVKPSRARDEAGKFAKTQSATAPAKAAPTTVAVPAAVDPTKPAAPVAPEALKAPQSWKPAAREKWAGLPPEAQSEVLRREKEVAVSLQQAAQAKQQWGQFEQTVQPYAAMIQAEGGDVMATVGSLLQTAAALRTAPAGHKAALIANVIRQFGVPIEALAAALDGQPVPQGQAQQQQSFDPNQLAQRIEQQVMQRFTQQRTQAMQSKVATEIDSFGQKNEFFSDVRHDMADILEMAAKRGLTLSPEEAYARACALHPEVSRVLEQRKAAEQANTATVSTQRAIRAGSSVKNQPATAVTSDGPTSRRGDIEAALAKLSGR
jgi:sulfur carrier protein ThiS